LQVGGPPSAGAFKAKNSGNTAFKKFYGRGDFPIALEHDTKGNKIAWKVCVGSYNLPLICKLSKFRLEGQNKEQGFDLDQDCRRYTVLPISVWN
jgi:hypothetical protein